MNKRAFVKRGLLLGFLSPFSFLTGSKCVEENKEIEITGAKANLKNQTGLKNAVPFIRSFPAIGTINQANFLSRDMPHEWVAVGGFKPTIQGLQSPVKGGWDVYAYWPKLIVLDEDMVSCQVEVTDPKSIFSIARISDQKKGTVAEVDFKAQQLKLYSELPASGKAPETVVAQSEITFPAVAGRTYKLILQKVSENYHVKFYDTVTQESAEINYLDTGKTPTSGKAWNFPGFIFRAGSVKLLDFNFSSGLPKNPKVLVVGDSITDGDTIRVQPNGGYKNRWAGLLAEALAHNVTIVARGGETSGNVNDKLPLLKTMLGAPEYVIYAIGTNDTSLETWRSNYLRFKQVFEAKGAVVIPATLFPRIGRETFCAEVNGYIRESGSRYLNFGKVLTNNGDGSTRNEALLLPDKLHPNPAGHLKMFNQVKIDLPDLFI